MPFMQYIVLHARNLDATVQFYERLLRISFQKERHNKGPKHYSYHLENLLFEIYPVKKQVQGDTILGFQVENLEVLLDNIEEIPLKVKQTENCRYAVFKDPDGRKIHLIEKGGSCKLTT